MVEGEREGEKEGRKGRDGGWVELRRYDSASYRKQEERVRRVFLV